MNHPLPPLHWLRAFEASARHLSFTAAAVELNLTQAGVSKQIKLLEYHLGDLLFVRRARSLQLTSSGAAFLPKVRDAFERLSVGAAEVFGGRRSSILTVRCNVSFAVSWLAKRLPAFEIAHPDKPFRIVSSIWKSSDEGAATRLGEGDLYDLDIQYGSGDWPGSRCDRLTLEQLFPVCSPDFLARQPIDTAANLSRYKLINVLGYETGWHDWLGAAGVRTRDLTFQHVDTSLMAYELAANGSGVALGRTSLIEDLIGAGRLVRALDHSIETREGFFLLSSRLAPEHPHADAFRTWLVSICKLDASA